jgi:hypothetical protein
VQRRREALGLPLVHFTPPVDMQPNPTDSGPRPARRLGFARTAISDREVPNLLANLEGTVSDREALIYRISSRIWCEACARWVWRGIARRCPYLLGGAPAAPERRAHAPAPPEVSGRGRWSHFHTPPLSVYSSSYSPYTGGKVIHSFLCAPGCCILQPWAIKRGLGRSPVVIIHTKKIMGVEMTPLPTTEPTARHFDRCLFQ